VVDERWPKSWKIHFHDAPYWEVFDPQKLVVLSPDAEEVMDKVDEDEVYVIGGLVDRSVKKGCTLTQAHSVGLNRCLRFPMQRRSLNIDTVVHILIERMKGDDWNDVLDRCLPRRHQCKQLVVNASSRMTESLVQEGVSGNGDSAGNGRESSDLLDDLGISADALTEPYFPEVQNVSGSPLVTCFPVAD